MYSDIPQKPNFIFTIRMISQMDWHEKRIVSISSLPQEDKIQCGPCSFKSSHKGQRPFLKIAKCTLILGTVHSPTFKGLLTLKRFLSPDLTQTKRALLNAKKLIVLNFQRSMYCGRIWAFSQLLGKSESW